MSRAYNEEVSAYRTEATPETVVCGACGEHGARSETTFTGEGALVCRRCAANASILAAAPRVAAMPARVGRPLPAPRRSWTDFVLGALVPVPLFLTLAAFLLLALAMMGSSDPPFGALLGAALLWPLAIVALVVTARVRFARISLANGLLISALVSLALGAAGAVLVVGAMASGIRG